MPPYVRIYLAPPGKSNQASQDIVGNFQKYFNFDPSDYFGCRLLAIEGVEVVKSLKVPLMPLSFSSHL